MLTGNLWPAHPHPYVGECLSSWLVRTAHNNGLKIQTFGHFAFDKRYEIWNRDVDRIAPLSLMQQMSEKTGTHYLDTLKTTMKLFENRLFLKNNLSGQLRWIIPLKLEHRTFSGYGMQFCPQCLMEDKEAYYRIGWRVSFYTFCPKHMILMRDRCSYCEAPICFHRIELGKYNLQDAPDLSVCYNCKASLANNPSIPVDIWHKNVFLRWGWILSVIDRNFINSGPLSYKKLILLHQLCRLISSKNLAPDLQQYLCDKTNKEFIKLESAYCFEQRQITERHYILELAWWFIEKYPRKIKEAISKNIINKNYLYRDNETDLKSFIVRKFKKHKD